jgi:hypothetical protein
METMTLAEQATPIAETQVLRPLTRWSLAARIGFRFVVVYFGMYCVLTQIINSVLVIPKIDVPDWASKWPIRPTVFWVAAHVFHQKVPLVYSGSGSGDKVFDWVLLFCMLVTAATAMWSVLDRRRAAYPKLHTWFWLFLRFCLAGQMFSYGLVKAMPLQMPYPFLSKLVEPFGNMSPMGVLWYSIGSAPAYETFAGCAEMLGGLLLIFPRTRTLGALIALADMTQVFMLNMTYDVPVKLLSFHLIVLALLLLTPEMKRMANFFFLDRAAEPAVRVPLFAGRRAQRIATGVIAFLWVWMLGNGIYSTVQDYKLYGPGAPKSPLRGIWNITDKAVDGQPKPLLVNEGDRWRRVIFDFEQYVQVQKMDDSMTGFGATLDAKTNTLTLNDPRGKTPTGTFTLSRPSPDHMILDGMLSGHKTRLELQRQDEKKFLLESRGFHWVQDYPFNR